MADPHFTEQRANWVKQRAGANLAAQRRGERLAVRARAHTREVAGAGDGAVVEAVTRHRVHRMMRHGEGHRMARVLGAGIYEIGRALLAGPGLAAAWAGYGLLYRQVPQWGPPRWRRLAAIAGAVAGVMTVVAAVLWWGADVPLLGWWLLAQPVIATARLAWLVRAYGWEAVEGQRAGKTARVAPIQVRRPAPQTNPTIKPISIPGAGHEEDTKED